MQSEPSLRERIAAEIASTPEPSNRETALGCGGCLLVLGFPVAVVGMWGWGPILLLVLWGIVLWMLVMVPIAAWVAPRVLRGDTALPWQATRLKQFARRNRVWGWTLLLRARVANAVGAMTPRNVLASVHRILRRGRWIGSHQLALHEGRQTFLPPEGSVFAWLAIEAVLLLQLADAYPLTALPAGILGVVLWCGAVLLMTSLLLPMNGMRSVLFRSPAPPALACVFLLVTMGVAVFVTSLSAHATLSVQSLTPRELIAGSADMFSLRYVASTAFLIVDLARQDPLQAVLAVPAGLWFATAVKYALLVTATRRTDEDRTVLVLGLLPTGATRAAERVARRIQDPSLRRSFLASCYVAQDRLPEAWEQARLVTLPEADPARQERLLVLLRHREFLAGSRGYERLIEEWLAEDPGERMLFHVASQVLLHATPRVHRALLEHAARRASPGLMAWFVMRGELCPLRLGPTVCSLDRCVQCSVLLSQQVLVVGWVLTLAAAGSERLGEAFDVWRTQRALLQDPGDPLRGPLSEVDLLGLHALQDAALLRDMVRSWEKPTETREVLEVLERIASRRAELLPDDREAQDPERCARDILAGSRSVMTLARSASDAPQAMWSGWRDFLRRPERIHRLLRMRF